VIIRKIRLWLKINRSSKKIISDIKANNFPKKTVDFNVDDIVDGIMEDESIDWDEMERRASKFVESDHRPYIYEIDIKL